MIIINIKGLKKKERITFYISNVKRIKGDKVFNGERIDIFLNTVISLLNIMEKGLGNFLSRRKSEGKAGGLRTTVDVVKK